MKPRHERIEVLRLILANTEIGSQEALLKELEAEGYKVTQATLSRDLQKLKAAKVASVGGYRYRGVCGFCVSAPARQDRRGCGPEHHR